MKMPSARRRLPVAAILIIIMAGALLASAIIGWQRWQHLASTSIARVDEVRRVYMEATDPAAERANRLQAVGQLAAYEEEPLRCEGEWWYGWLADVVPFAAAAAKTCKDQQAIVMPVTQRAAVLARYLEEEAKLAPIVSSLEIDSKKSDWQARALASAVQADTDLALLKPSAEFKPMLETTKQQVNTIVTRWRVLQEASLKQDRKTYEAALDGIDNAYSGLAVIVDTSDDTIADMLELLLVAGKKL